MVVAGRGKLGAVGYVYFSGCCVLQLLVHSAHDYKLMDS